jgi:hypothetical protein
MKSLRSVLLTLCPFLLISSVITAAQSSPMSVGGVLTNPLTAAPTVSVSTNCSGGGTTWKYSVTALDAAGGSTVGTAAQTTAGCTTALISASNYNKITITAANGSVSCNIYRVLPASAIGRIANIPCGLGIATIYLDISTATVDSTSAPTTDTTGSVTATGIVTAQAFNANAGGNAGTSAWVSAGGALPPCGSQPCVPSNSFFVQAPSGLSSIFGWTLPAASNTANQLVYAGPTATDSGGKQAAPLGYIASDSTVSHALFATSTQPAFRAIGTSDTTPNYYAADTTNTNSYAVTLSPAVTGLTTGTIVRFKVSNANTTASNINVNSLGATNIYKGGTTPLAPGDLLAGIIYTITYDGTNWQLLNPSALSSYSTNQTAATAASVSFSGTANQATLFGIVIPAPGVVTSQVSYEIATADSSTHTYDIGVYAGLPSTGESPLIHIGSIAGTIFAPSANTWQTRPWSGSTTIYLPAGRYYLAITSSCIATCATIAGQNQTAVFATGSVTVTSGGTLSSVTTLSDSVINIGAPTFYLH